jgi:hypothetical protein
MTADRTSEARPALERDLATATLRALRESYRELNQNLFGGVLRTPAIGLGRSPSQLGLWNQTLRSIEISEALLLQRGWGAAIEVLKHEMTHQFVHDADLGGDEPPHGPTFRKVCRDRGIDARASGDPSNESPDHPILGRVRKLLSLAQSSNEHEAQSAARIAQRLMLRHNIDQLSVERGDGYTSRQLGRTTGRTTEAERILGTILQEHFFVDVIWVYGFRPLDGKHGRVMEACGRSENVDLADYVHDFVTRTAERLWKEHRVAEDVRNNRDRRAFLAGVMTGFRDQLDKQKVRQVGSGLIWLGDPELRSFFARRHPSISVRSYYEQGSNPAREDGRRAGREIVLHRGIDSSRQGSAAKQLVARTGHSTGGLEISEK